MKVNLVKEKNTKDKITKDKSLRYIFKLKMKKLPIFNKHRKKAN